ncbi:MAG: aspartate kinase [Bacteroidetes bacterium]|nr:aspartate kinase [Bacteroidota bacterium]
MKVFKFGGASVNSVERIQNLAGIVKSYQDQPLVIIISAMGKTTNSLEKVAESFYAGNKNEALQLFDAVKQHHLNISKYLLVTQFNECLLQLTDFFTEVEWLLHDKPVREYDYYYDQVVCIGELLSTAIISHYLNESGISNEWLDVRDLLRTDNTFRDASVDWETTSERIRYTVSQPGIYLTQGFIGCTADNESTTLGREGSDFTAAIFANILNAESLTIWKDVEAVMNADPKRFPEAQPLQELNFTEVIEMAYYGAQVIHPKTIKPLQNKGIPLHVKCFLNPELPGTLIHKKNSRELPPIIVVKENQALLHLNSQDFSFVGEEPMSWLYTMLHKLKTKPNLIQTGAINVQLCMDYRAEKIEQLAAAAASLFDVQVEKDLTLLTIRHYNTATFEQLTRGKEIVLTQRTVDTVQVLVRQ